MSITPIKSISYNTTTPANTNWILAIPRNDYRVGFSIENRDITNSLKIGIGDELGNVTEFLTVPPGQYRGQQEFVITGPIFIASTTTSSLTVLISEFIL